MANGNIDQLNFEVILDDEKFNRKVTNDIETAKRLNASLTETLNLKQRISATSKTAYLDEQKMAQAAAKTAQEKARQALQEQKVRTEVEKTTAAHERAKAAIEKSSQSLSGTGNSLLRGWLRFTATMWSIISVIRIFSQAVGKVVKNLADFQQANANLATIMQVSRSEVRVLTEDALMLGRTTEWTASQVTELQTALAKLGYNIPQIRNMQASILQFATAVGANLPDAANLAGASLRMFGMHSTEMQKALEILTASTNKTALDFEKLKVSLPYVGAIAHSIGLDIAQTASLLGVLTNAGLASSRAGTGLRQVLLELSKQNGKLQTAMGGNIKTFDDFVNGLQLMRDRGLEAGEAANLVSTRASSALLILANGVDDIRRLNKEVRDTDGLLKDIQSERLNTLHGSTLLLKSAWEGLIQTFRDSTGPMKDVVDWLTNIIRATSLAASRANRVAQGTKDGFWGWLARPGLFSKGITGSDDLTKQFTEQYNGLIKNGLSPEEAAKIVQDGMAKWHDEAQAELIRLQGKGYKESGWNRALYYNPITNPLVAGKMNAGREANEQVEAIENAMDAVSGYMTNHAKESAEMAANEYLEEWKLIFDTKGADAARAAMKAVAGYENIKSRVEAYIANGGESGAADRGKGKKTKTDPNADARQNLRAEISTLEKLKSIYDRREAVFGKDAAIAWVFNNMGYDVKNLDRDLEKLIADLRSLGDEQSLNAAESIEASLGLDQTSKDIKAFNEAEKALKAYEKALEKFDKDWGSGDTSGASYKAESVLKKYTNEKKKIEDEWEEFTKAAVKANKDVGKSERDLYEARKKANENTMTEGLRGLVDDIFKEKFNGKELSDWSHKSLSDIMGIKNAVETMELPEDIKAMVLQKGGDSALAELQKAFDEYRQNLITGTIDPEFFKKSSKYAKSLASYISKAGDAMKRLGEATNNAGLSDAGQAISAIGQNLNAAAEGYEKSGSWIGAVVGGVVDIFNQIVDATGRANEKMREMEDAVRRIRSEAESVRFSDFLSDGVDDIFGDNFVRRIKNAIDAVRVFGKDANEIYDSLFRKSRELLDADTSRALAALNGFSVYDSNDSPWGSVNRIMVKTAKEWAGGEYKSLEKLANDLNLELFDNNGFLNPVLLDKVINEYGDLNHELSDLFTEAKLQAEEYAQAMKQIEDATKDIFGNLASDMADQFIDNFLAMGNAVDDLSGTFANLGDAILRSFLQSYVLDEILTKYEADATAALKRYSTGQMTPDEYAAWLDGFAQNVQQEAETLAPAINGMIEAFKDRGLMNIDENTANSLGSGIKGITEETANLLASYINAIRADVSYMRVMQEKGWADVAAIAGAVSSPTLNDYLAQISATTFDIAQSNQSILSELRSVIGAPGTSGMVVRVEAY